MVSYNLANKSYRLEYICMVSIVKAFDTFFFLCNMFSHHLKCGKSR